MKSFSPAFSVQRSVLSGFGVASGDNLKIKALQSNANQNYSLFIIHYSLISSIGEGVADA